MSISLESPIVCQIPGCTTTQMEIEAELASFLNSFCAMCRKDRGGKLCSCAFPCSLTFKSQMLVKIHELLGLEKPPDRRAIQVCFKHPDLLKQAREACVMKRDENNRLKRKSGSSVTNSLEHDGQQPKTKITKSDKSQQQPKMCKIQFQDTEEELSSSEEQEEFAEIIPNCSRSMPMTSTASPQKSVKIRFRLADSDDSGSDKDLEMEDQEDLEQQLNDIFGSSSDSDDQSIDQIHQCNSNASSGSTKILIQKSPSRKVMKIHYQDYYRRILQSEMKSLMHQSYLNDLQFICADGNVITTNSLILGSMSPYLYNILADVPIVDRLKTVIVPDVPSADLNVLFKLLFNQQSSVSLKDMKRIKSLASLFRLEPILVLTRKPGRPKGSQNKPKTKIQSTKVRLVHTEIFDEEDDDRHSDHDVVEETEEDLEIFKSAAEILSENCDTGSRQQQASGPGQQPNQSTLNLLPNSDILDQIAQETGS